jgi:hypothetical protein
MKEKFKIPKSHDKRCKLSDEEKLQINKLYDSGLYTLRELATTYNVSCTTIYYVINNDAYQTNKKVQRKSKSCNRNEIMKRYRLHRKHLEESNLLENTRLEEMNHE